MNKKKWNPTTVILTALILGVAVGLIFGEKAAILQPIGNIYLNLIKMIVIPLVMCSIISAITGVSDMGKLGRVGIKMFLLYAGTSAAAACIGVAIASIGRLGSGMTFAAEAVDEAAIAETQIPNLFEALVNFVPENICGAMADFQTLPCIVFSVFFGAALIIAGEKAVSVKNWIDGMTEVVYVIINIVLKIAPIGVFSLVASGIGLYGAELLTTFGLFIVFQIVADAFLFAVYLVILGVNGLNPLTFIKAIGKVAIMAFTTRSSAATLPLNIKTAVEELQVREDIANFTMPIGTTINMNGAALSMAMKAVMAGYLFNMQLSFGQMAIAVVLCVISGMGVSAVPSAGVVFDLLLYTTLGLPAETMIGMFTGIGNITDMIDTTFNVMGDSVCAVVVSKSEERFEKKNGNTIQQA